MLLTLAGVWGGSFFFYKILVAELPPFTVVLGRVGIAAIILNLWLLLRGDFMPTSPRLWRQFILMGLLNNAIPFSLIVFGEMRISSGLAAILNATTPIFGVLVAHALTRNEKLTGGRAAGVAIGFAGVAVLVGPGVLAGLGSGSVLGEAASLVAALTYAFAGVYGRRFAGLSPLKVATGQTTAATLLLLPLVAIVDRPWSLPAPSATAWAALLGIALLCTVAAYILYFAILAAAGATNLLLVTFLVPVSALLLGALVLGEALQGREFVGMALIGGSLAFIDGRPLRRLRGKRVSRSPAAAPPAPRGASNRESAAANSRRP